MISAAYRTNILIALQTPLPGAKAHGAARLGAASLDGRFVAHPEASFSSVAVSLFLELGNIDFLCGLNETAKTKLQISGSNVASLAPLHE